MPLVNISVPPKAIVSNYLFAGEAPEDHDEDLLTVRLPTGFFVDLGWYPAGDRNGRYVVRVFREYWNHQVIEPIKILSQDDAIKCVEYLARRFSQDMVNTATGGSKTTIISPPRIASNA